MRFSHGFSARELRSGHQMIVHPISGKLLSKLDFDSHRQLFSYEFKACLWDIDSETIYELPIYTNDMGVEIGDPFPSSWEFDPFTGRRIVSTVIISLAMAEMTVMYVS